MIQPTTENKYRFNMQVSARAMGCPDHSLLQPDDSAARSIFEIFDQRFTLAGVNCRPKQMDAPNGGDVVSYSQIRDSDGESRIQPGIEKAVITNGPCETGRESNRRALPKLAKNAEQWMMCDAIRQRSYAVPPTPIFR
jgi:hypothetical protein